MSTPRLIDQFSTKDSPRWGEPRPKRIAPRRGDPALDARAIARIAMDHDINIAKGNIMPKYQTALDSVPQDGRWLDDPNAVTTVLQFLLSKLSATDLAELDEHLTNGTLPQATDGRLPEGDCKRNLLLYTPRNRRNLISALRGATSSGRTAALDAEQRKSYDEMFPNAGRLKRGY